MRCNLSTRLRKPALPNTALSWSSPPSGRLLSTAGCEQGISTAPVSVCYFQLSLWLQRTCPPLWTAVYTLISCWTHEKQLDSTATSCYFIAKCYVAYNPSSALIISSQSTTCPPWVNLSPESLTPIKALIKYYRTILDNVTRCLWESFIRSLLLVAMAKNLQFCEVCTLNAQSWLRGTY